MSSVLNCIATPRASNLRCEVASRTFEEGVSTLTVREQQSQALYNARQLVQNARERQVAEVVARLTARRESILRDIARADDQITAKTKKIDELDHDLQSLPKIL